MSEGLSVGIYLGLGVGFAALVYFRSHDGGISTVASAIAAVVIWPLWAPFALAATSSTVGRGPFVVRIAAALDDARAAVEGTVAERTLRRDEVASLMRRVEAADRRLAELESRLGAKVLEGACVEGAGAEDNARAQIRASHIAKLQALRDREHLALQELAELCELLRTQLVLARFGATDGVDELRDELWARVQTLSELELN